MSNPHANSKVNTGEDGIVVRAPRAGDTISFALSAAFDCDDGLPEDWKSILAQIDGASSPQRQR